MLARHENEVAPLGFKNTGNDHRYVHLAFQCVPEAAEPPPALNGLL